MTACCAAVELGGTRIAVLAGAEPRRCSEVVRLSTSGPTETMAEIVGALRTLRAEGWEFEAIGVASFGPLELNRSRPGFGHLLATPKFGWTGADLVGVLSRALGTPVVLETDVNAAAIGEGRWGASRGLDQHAYVTAGTGVGAGLCVAGAPLHGLLHPEAGHLPALRDPKQDPFAGVCPWHGDCVEGLASGPAVAGRLGGKPEDVARNHPVWALAGGYLGQLCASLVYVASPERIVLGGGVGSRPQVLDAARRSLADRLAGYLIRPRAEELDTFLVAPQLGADSGLFGALALALDHRSQAKLSADLASPPL